MKSFENFLFILVLVCSPSWKNKFFLTLWFFDFKPFFLIPTWLIFIDCKNIIFSRLVKQFFVIQKTNLLPFFCLICVCLFTFYSILFLKKNIFDSMKGEKKLVITVFQWLPFYNEKKKEKLLFLTFLVWLFFFKNTLVPSCLWFCSPTYFHWPRTVLKKTPVLYFFL